MIHSLLESNMREAVTLDENLQKDGSINWSFVDADCYMTIGHYFKDQNDYMESFNKIAEQLEAEMNPVTNEIQLEMEI